MTRGMDEGGIIGFQVGKHLSIPMVVPQWMDVHWGTYLDHGFPDEHQGKCIVIESLRYHPMNHLHRDSLDRLDHPLLIPQWGDCELHLFMDEKDDIGVLPGGPSIVFLVPDLETAQLVFATELLVQFPVRDFGWSRSTDYQELMDAGEILLHQGVDHSLLVLFQLPVDCPDFPILPRYQGLPDESTTVDQMGLDEGLGDDGHRATPTVHVLVQVALLEGMYGW